jgi:hypothetical protein
MCIGISGAVVLTCWYDVLILILVTITFKGLIPSTSIKCVYAPLKQPLHMAVIILQR